MDTADLVVVVSPCDVRACAATATIASVLTGINPNVGLVVRGPSPGGLRAEEVAAIAALPLLASMRPYPRLAEQLEHGGLRLRSALCAGGGGPPRPGCAAGAPGGPGGRQGGMTGSLIDRVRERLATESAPLRPMVVADAIRAESGGVLGDTELLSNLRVLQTELTGAGDPRATVVRGRHH